MERQFGVEEVRSLREEIHLARVMIETRLDMIEEGDKGDMLSAFSSINTYLQTIEKLTSSCHKMEISLGSLLTKSSVFALGQDLVGILAEELQGIENYEETIDRISERLVVAIANTQNEEKTK
jgi:DNA helicase HerA-like ATPase